MERHIYQSTAISLEAMLLGISVVVMCVFLVIWICAAVWVGKQAKMRGMDNPALWVLIALMFPVVGWLVFALLMPSGLAVPCDICGNKKLETLLNCPHCGYPTKAGASVVMTEK